MSGVTFQETFNFSNIQKKVLRDIIDLVIMREKSRYFQVAGEGR